MELNELLLKEKDRLLKVMSAIDVLTEYYRPFNPVNDEEPQNEEWKKGKRVMLPISNDSEINKLDIQIYELVASFSQFVFPIDVWRAYKNIYKKYNYSIDILGNAVAFTFLKVFFR